MALVNDQAAESYLTIAQPGEGLFKSRGSKHFGFVFPVHSEIEIDVHLKELRSRFPDAGHHAYAFRLGMTGEIWRASDDGEPKNSAGPPIHGALKSLQLTQCLGVVIRYFGGTKLGVSGLIEAYREATLAALENVQIVERFIEDEIDIHFPYDKTGPVMAALSRWDCRTIHQSFDVTCVIRVAIATTHTASFIRSFEEIFGVYISPVDSTGFMAK